MFHIFKRDVKKYSNFADHIRKIKILCEIEPLLDDFAFENLCITKENGRIILNDSISHLIMEEEILKSETVGIVEEKNESTEDHLIKDDDMNEEYIFDQDSEAEVVTKMNQSFSISETEAVSADEIHQILDPSESIEEIPGKKLSKTRKYSYAMKTNNDLTEKEKTWISSQVKRCEILIDDSVQFRCPLCKLILKLSTTFKRHLRDSHVLKPKTKQLQVENRNALKDEITQSEMTVTTSKGAEKIWKCQRCKFNRIFRSEGGLKFHIRNHHIRKGDIDEKYDISNYKIVQEEKDGKIKNSWQCPKCSKILSARETFRNHIKCEHPEMLRLMDESKKEIGKITDEPIEVLLEKNKRSLKHITNKYSCYECGIVFTSKSCKINKLVKQHSDCHKIFSVVSEFYELPKCESTKVLFCNDIDLSFYLESGQLPLSCDGMTMRVAKKFKEAEGSCDDKNQEGWTCGHCCVKFLTERECICHVMMLHTKKFICPNDYMEFDGNRGICQFIIHMHNKHNEMFPDLIIKCSYCGSNFQNQFDKLAHMKTCKEKKFQCDHCGKLFFTKTDLTRHLKLVVGELNYTCQICQKPCSSTMELKIHQTTHTNIRLYACSYPNCSKTFKSSTARSSHMETHGNTTYACMSCQSIFKHRILLSKHIREGKCLSND